MAFRWSNTRGVILCLSPYMPKSCDSVIDVWWSGGSILEI